jgi:predicted regulator of Ras-like GTPase activity (Roadblock/LC7/MglB family)
VATTEIQEARAIGTGGILAEMPDDATSATVSADAAEAALAYLDEMSIDLRGAAILDSAGTVLAASGDPERWHEDAATLFEVADRAGGEPVEQVHIGTEQGEVFALRHAGLAAVAVTDRFALASLTFFDMRSLLRDLAAGGDGRGHEREGGDAA